MTPLEKLALGTTVSKRPARGKFDIEKLELGPPRCLTGEVGSKKSRVWICVWLLERRDGACMCEAEW